MEALQIERLIVRDQSLQVIQRFIRECSIEQKRMSVSPNCMYLQETRKEYAVIDVIIAAFRDRLSKEAKTGTPREFLDYQYEMLFNINLELEKLVQLMRKLKQPTKMSDIKDLLSRNERLRLLMDKDDITEEEIKESIIESENLILEFEHKIKQLVGLSSTS